MLEDDGHWLKLMREAAVPAEANICLHIKGTDVICTVTSDITREVELKVTCCVSSQGNVDQTINISNLENIESPYDDDLHGQNDDRSEADSQLNCGQKLTEMLDLSFKDSNEEDADLDTMTSRIGVKKIGDSRFTEPDYTAKHESDKVEDDVNSNDGNQEMERNVSPSIGNRDGTNTRTSTEPRNPERAKVFKVEDDQSTSPNFEQEIFPGSSPDPDSNPKTKSSPSGRFYKCHLCAFSCYRLHILTNHLKSHSVPTIKETVTTDSGSSSNSAWSFCTACKIQFMSVKTYQVHKQFYCSSRHHESSTYNDNLSPSRAELEPQVITGHADVPVQTGSTVNAPTMSSLASVIQPQAIFAAISTNPLILLPLSFRNGQGLVPHNGIISTSTGIVLPAGIDSTGSIENGGVTIQIRQPQCEIQLTEGENSAPMDKTAFLNPLLALHALKSNCATIDKRQTVDGNVLNLKKPVSKSEQDSTTKQSDVEFKTEFINAFQEVPLDLSLKKRKLSLSSDSVQRPLIKRRNSSASSAPTSPRLQFSTAYSSSPETSQTRVASPPVFSNDASCSSGFGTVVAPNSVHVNGIQVLCKTSDRLSPVPPVLLSTVDGPTTSQRIVHSLGVTPSKMLKQGNNRCEDCNIVFYKYDNYLAHKKHYCAYRRRQESSESESAVNVQDQSNTSDDNNSNQDAMDLPGKIYVTDEIPPKPVNAVRHVANLEFGVDNIVPATTISNHKPQNPVYGCDNCGVKFSTSDNLNAHQTYYCKRKGDMSFSKCNPQFSRRNNTKSREYPCGRCGEPSSKGHEESCYPGEWKCNYCEVVCSSIKTAQKHLLTHTEIRGFCCTVCGYRGNTIRGMRAHVYEHLNGDHSQIEDLLAASVVVDSSGSSGRALRFRVQDCSDEDSNNTECKPLNSREDSTSKRILKTYSNVASSPAIRIPRKQSNYQRNSESEECSRSPQNNLFSNDSREVSPNKELESTPSSYEQVHGSIDEEETENESKDNICRGGMDASKVCDVLIKTEEDSVEKIIPERSKLPSTDGENYVMTRIKTETVTRDEQSDVENTTTDKQNDKSAHGTTSVICKISSHPTNSGLLKRESVQANELSQKPYVQKKKLRAQTKSSTELKYCKSCDISFHHLSNFLAHKRFYCVPRVIETFQQETAPVQ